MSLKSVRRALQNAAITLVNPFLSSANLHGLLRHSGVVVAEDLDVAMVVDELELRPEIDDAWNVSLESRSDEQLLQDVASLFGRVALLAQTAQGRRFSRLPAPLADGGVWGRAIQLQIAHALISGLDVVSPALVGLLYAVGIVVRLPPEEEAVLFGWNFAALQIAIEDPSQWKFQQFGIGPTGIVDPGRIIEILSVLFVKLGFSQGTHIVSPSDVTELLSASGEAVQPEFSVFVLPLFDSAGTACDLCVEMVAVRVPSRTSLGIYLRLGINISESPIEGLEIRGVGRVDFLVSCGPVGWNIYVGAGAGSEFQLTLDLLTLAGADFAPSRLAGIGSFSVEHFLVGARLGIEGGLPDPAISVNLNGLVAELQLGSALSSIVPSATITVRAALLAELGLRRGFRLGGGAGLSFAIGSGVQLGPVSVHEPILRFNVGPQGGGASVRVGIAVVIGPVSLSVDGFGLSTTINYDGSVSFGATPPVGLAINIDTGPVRGGGFIAYDDALGRYTGALALSVANTIAIRAIGILDTRAPGISGYSFLIVISVEFTPIQIGFGFTLNGVGGLCGIQRSVSVRALQEGIRTGSIAPLLFARDPVAQASQLVTGLSQVFPPTNDRYVFGPMFKFVTVHGGLRLPPMSPAVDDGAGGGADGERDLGVGLAA